MNTDQKRRVMRIGTRVLSPRGPGLIVDFGVWPETIAQPAEPAAVVELDDGRHYWAHLQDLDLEERQLTLEDHEPIPLWEGEPPQDQLFTGRDDRQ